MKLTRAFLTLVLAASCAAPASAQTQSPLTPEQARQIDAYGATAIRSLHIPGMAVAVVRDGAVIYRKAFGVSNLATKTPLRADAAFEIGSITKQFTAAAVMQLADEGKLRLDDPLGAYTHAYTAADAVTIRQLLYQVSGIPDYTESKNFEIMAPKTKPSFDRVIALIRNKPLEFTPGTKWKYSNTNYFLLGRVIESASRQSYTDYLFEHVIRPAAMSATSSMDDERKVANFATGYWPKRKGALSPAPPFGGGWAWSAGYLVSNVDDMVKWDAAYFGGKIVSPADVTLATTSGKLADGKDTAYGFGWLTDMQNGHPRIWHNGGTFGFTAANVTYPQERVAVIVMANALTTPQAVAARIYDVLYPPSLKNAAGEDPAITAKAKEWLRRFQTGDLDRSQFSPKMSAALTPSIVESAKDQFGPLGSPKTITFISKNAVGHSNVYVYRCDFESISLNLIMSIDSAGKIDGFFFKPA